MPYLTILLAAVAVALIAYVTQSLCRRLKPVQPYDLVACNSMTSGPHGSGRITRIADAAFTSRYLIAKPGATPASTMAIGTADAIPLGVVVDEPAQNDPGAIALFGVTPGTLVVRAGAAITAGDQVIVTAAGKAITLPTANGTYYIIGRALDAAAADGDKVEIQHTYPVKVTVSGG